MQKDYKNAMEHISLSDDDKARILANVKKTYEQSAPVVDDLSEKVVPLGKKPRFSPRQMGAVAASFVVICASALLIHNQFIGKNAGNGDNMPGAVSTMQPAEEVVWQELDSVEDIEKETDCRTYTLDSVSKKYQVKKVEVAQTQKHVRITYKNKKDADKILFEYKEEENAADITGQFENETELATEKVGDSDVKMYGAEKCDAMTWQQESCTFAVRMSKACSTEKAKKIVSGTKKRESGADDSEGSGSQRVHGSSDTSANPNAVGWKGNEGASGTKQKKNLLREIYNRLGFRVTIEEPAEDVAYKKVGDFESFAFYYNEDEELAYNRIIGYAGWEGCPEGVMENYEEIDVTSVNGVHVTVYQNKNEEKLFGFIKQDISFTLLIEDWTGENTEDVLSELLSVIHISMDNGDSESGKDEKLEKEEEKAAPLREAAQKIQDAVAEESLKKLSSYIAFPLSVKGLEMPVESTKEFQELPADMIFTGEWVDAVVSYDTNKIKADTKTFTMGDSMNSLVCKIKNNSVIITELNVANGVALPNVTPLEE